MVILSLSMLVATGCGMVDMVLIMAGRTSWNLGNALLALAVNLVARPRADPAVRHHRRGDRLGGRDPLREPGAVAPR